MTRAELEHCAKAVTAAARTLVEALGTLPPELTPEQVLDQLSMDDLKFLVKDWPAEADREAERRRDMVVEMIRIRRLNGSD